MPLDSDRVQALVRAELARINDRAVALAIERLLVPPSAVDRGWDYGSPGQTHTCWTVLEHPSSNTAIAFCEHGFGPSDPWGIVSIRGPKTTMGMDAAWFHTLEGAFRESPACEFYPPDGYEVE